MSKKLKQLTERVEALEADVARLKSPPSPYKITINPDVPNPWIASTSKFLVLTPGISQQSHEPRVDFADRCCTPTHLTKSQFDPGSQETQ